MNKWMHEWMNCVCDVWPTKCGADYACRSPGFSYTVRFIDSITDGTSCWIWTKRLWRIDYERIALAESSPLNWFCRRRPPLSILVVVAVVPRRPIYLPASLGLETSVGGRPDRQTDDHGGSSCAATPPGHPSVHGGDSTSVDRRLMLQRPTVERLIRR